MHIISNKAQAPTPFPGIEHVTLAGRENGLEHLSIWQQSIAPGGATPPHRHDCEEVVLCTAGEGELHVAGRVERFSANMTIVIPPHVDHQIISVGKEPLQTMAVFASTPVGVWLPDGEPVELPWPT
jgi:quercetin dioxygenase-like cupin family protein